MSSKLGEGKGSASDSEDTATLPPPPKKVCFSETDFTELSKEQLCEKLKELEKYVGYLEEDHKEASTQDEGSGTRTGEERAKGLQDSTPRENVLVMRLATKEQEIQELLAQINELKHSQNPATSQLRSTLLDPAVNILFEKMKSGVTEAKEKLEQAQNDLSAWKFTPDSVTGKKLMAKCRMLIQENQDLGKQLSQGRLAQLEAELALQKKYSEELKGSQDELNDFVIQLDEEVEGMQSTICVLQQQLKESKVALAQRTDEVDALREQLAFLRRKSGQTTSHADMNDDNTDFPLDERTKVDDSSSLTDDQSQTNCRDDALDAHRGGDCVDGTEDGHSKDAKPERPPRTISVIQHSVEGKVKTPSPPKGHKAHAPRVDIGAEVDPPNHKLRTRETNESRDRDKLNNGGEETNDGDVGRDCNGELIAVGDR